LHCGVGFIVLKRSVTFLPPFDLIRTFHFRHSG
jgi:hypothetical protein